MKLGKEGVMSQVGEGEDRDKALPTLPLPFGSTFPLPLPGHTCPSSPPHLIPPISPLRSQSPCRGSTQNIDQRYSSTDAA